MGWCCVRGGVVCACGLWGVLIVLFEWFVVFCCLCDVKGWVVLIFVVVFVGVSVVVFLFVLISGF